jgi:outer membrane protein OmpA-like peptidoglycan-associated protein
VVAAVLAGGCSPRQAAAPPAAPLPQAALAATASGPAPDRDGDGIPDAEDACPDGAGLPSFDPELNGCLPPREARSALPGIMVAPTVTFAYGKSTVRAENKQLLDEIAKLLDEHDEIGALRVVGHATKDERDPDALGRARAEAVVKALVKRGVAPARLVVETRGVTEPRYENNDLPGRQGNRYVDFHLVEPTACATPSSGASP